MASHEAEVLAERVKELAPGDQLRLAAELIEAVRSGTAQQAALGIVEGICRNIALEICALRLLGLPKKPASPADR